MPLYGDEKREYQRKWIAKRRSDWFADKVCVICGSTDSLELDHIDPAQKVHHAIWSWSKVRRDIELAKCQVLCSGCHKFKTKEDLREMWDTDTESHGTSWQYGHGCKCDDCLSWLRWHWRAVRAINKQLRANNPEMTSKNAKYVTK